MLNKELKLNEDIFGKPETKSVRAGFGEGLLEAGRKHGNVVVLTADLKESTAADGFAKEFPKRFFDLGVAEQNLVTVASGFAVSGKIPFATSYAVFSPGRNWEQIRTTICYNNANVKILGSHAGLATGPDGATHQALEDLALMRTLPGMRVFSPCDAEEAKKAVIMSAEVMGPVYIRLSREKTPVITTPETPFLPGRTDMFWVSEKPECAIFATGAMVYPALLAALALEKEGVRTLVLNVSSVKPLDGKAVLSAVKKAKCVVSVEDHQTAGGMGSAIAEFLSSNFPVPQEFVGVKDVFGESGSADDLYKKHGLTKEGIMEAVRRAVSRKK